MISVLFTSSPLMPMASAFTSTALSTISDDVHLDAEVVHLVAVVGEDDVDEVLADVVDVALHRGQHDAALGGLAVDLVHHRLEVGDGGLHRLGRLQHERQLHLALAEEVADDLHPLEEDVVDDRRAESGPAARATSRSATRPSRSPSMMRVERRCSIGQSERSSFSTVDGADALEHRQELLERVVVVGAPVVDDVEADLLLLLGDPGERRDAGGVDDGRVEAGLGRLVEVHRVEDVAGRRVEAEGDVGEARAWCGRRAGAP